jgi:hypothetical protein
MTASKLLQTRVVPLPPTDDGAGMGDAHTQRGEMRHPDMPNWQPLLDLLGEELTGDFMWMFEVELDDGTLLQAYKHWYTRGYIHLAADGSAFVYESRSRYRSAPVTDVLAAVFVAEPGLNGITDEQIARSWAAVDRLEQATGGCEDSAWLSEAPPPCDSRAPTWARRPP